MCASPAIQRHSAPSIERAVHGLNPNLPLYSVTTLEHNMGMGNVFERIAVVFAGTFGLVAMLLAADWRLRRGFIHHSPAHPRDRHPHGAGRRARRCISPDSATGIAAHAHRPCCRPRLLAGVHPIPARNALWRGRHRLAHVRRSRSGAGAGGPGRMSHPRAACCIGRIRCRRYAANKKARQLPRRKTR